MSQSPEGSQVDSADRGRSISRSPRDGSQSPHDSKIRSRSNSPQTTNKLEPKYTKPEDDENGKSLYVRNITRKTTIEELEDLFKDYGKIVDVYIPRDYYTRTQKDFAYIKFENPDDADKAMAEKNGYKFFGRELFIDVAQGTRKSTNEMKDRDRRKPYRGRRRYSPYGRRPPPYGGGGRRRYSRSPPPRRRYRSRSRSPRYHDRRGGRRYQNDYNDYNDYNDSRRSPKYQKSNGDN